MDHVARIISTANPTSTDSFWPHADRPETAYNNDTNIVRKGSGAVELGGYGSVKLRRNSGLWGIGSCVLCVGYVSQAPVRSFFTFNPAVVEKTLYNLRETSYTYDPHKSWPRYHVATPSSPHHGLATFSCPTEISPIEQLMTQVTPQLLRGLLVSYGPRLPLSIRLSRRGGIWTRSLLPLTCVNN